MTDRPRWSVIMTTHNRAGMTLACLDALASQNEAGVDLEVVVCDAGSTDGTPEAIEGHALGATVLRRDSSLFWAAGMRAAWEHAATTGPHAYLWLNDDTVLDPDALARLSAWQEAAPPVGGQDAVLVGATRDPDTAGVTYSGVTRPDPRRRLWWDRVLPTESAQLVETMNGNIVLVPAAVVATIGLLDPVFEHGMADFDYGLRATRAGHGVVLLPGTFGTCRANPEVGARPMREEWRAMRSTKDLPPEQWFTFARRWAGPLWPVYAAAPYVRRLASSLRPSSTTRR